MRWPRYLVSLLLALLPVAAHAADSLALLPAEFTLTGPAARQTLLVEESRDGQYVGQVSGGVTFESSNPKVVAVENGYAQPTGNGTATLTARVGDRAATAKVTVVAYEKPHQWSFRNHV